MSANTALIEELLEAADIERLTDATGGISLLSRAAEALKLAERIHPVPSMPATTDHERAQLDEVDAIIAEALHEAWLRIHIARQDEQHHARSYPAYQRTGIAKSALEDAWESLKLEGRLFDPIPN